MSKNHLVIGLGGTGGSILQAFRKAIYREFKTPRPDVANLGYLYVDSDPEKMSADHPSWLVEDTSVPLEPDCQLLLSAADIPALLADPDASSRLKDWIEPRQVWSEFLEDAGAPTAMRPGRRFGRLLFASGAKRFSAMVQEQVSRLQQKGELSITFHLCAGLAGRTGSGSLIDAIALIRHLYPEPFFYRILLYTLLPEGAPSLDPSAIYASANGYATLLELNALSVGTYCPQNLTGEAGKLASPAPFNGCYIIGNDNGKGTRYDIDLEMPQIMADFLFQKIVIVKTVSYESLRRLESPTSGEISAARIALGKEQAQSRRFFSVGISRLRVPDEKPRDYLSCLQAKQVVRQLLYNHWTDDRGFIEEPLLRDYTALVSDPDTIQRWLLTDDHLRLSQGILPGEREDPSWRTIRASYQEAAALFARQIRENGASRQSWFEELGQLFERYFHDGFRAQGVERYYQSRTEHREAYLQAVRAQVESDLLAAWENGVYCLSDIKELLELLLNSLMERLEGYDQQIAERLVREEAATKTAEENTRRWMQTRFLPGLKGSRDAWFESQVECLTERFTCRTDIASFRFASDLLQCVIADLTSLWSEVCHCAASLSSLPDRFDKLLSDLLLESSAERQRLHDFAGRLIAQEQIQQKESTRIRRALLHPPDRKAGFDTIRQQLTESAFPHWLIDQCAASVREAQEILRRESPGLSGAFESNILEWLQEQYGDAPGKLEQFIRDWTLASGPLVIFRLSLSLGKTKASVQNNADAPVFSHVVLLPGEASHPEIYRRVTTAFRESVSGAFQFIPNRLIPCDIKQNEITLISVADLFPLRFLEQTFQMKAQYDRCLQGPNSARAKWDLHLEGDGAQHPDLLTVAK